MNNPKDNTTQSSEQLKNVPMFAASDPQRSAKEIAALRALQDKGLLKRWAGYCALTGPGWLQSALTLGGGSAMASLFAGAYLKYKLLWVQPFAMLIGIIMLAAVARQTLVTGIRPFDAIKRFLHPTVAWAWIFGALAVTIIWHFPQYALAAGMTEDMINAFTGYQPTGSARTTLLIVVGLVFLVISTAITWCYGSGYKGVRLYEKMLKSFVWLIIAAFAVVVVRSAIAGNINWGQLFKGFLPLELPFNDRRGFSVVMAAFAAAVGINSTFLLPYCILARGWTREHQSLSWFDLITGTFLPFVLVTSLVIIAAGSTIYDPAFFKSGSTLLSPIQAAKMFEAAGLNQFLSRIIFGLGVLGMTLSTITVHMLTCGFVVCEIFKIKPDGWRYRLACLIPAPAFTGVILWEHMGPWVAVRASAICGLLLPFAYTIFFILNNSEKYLGPDKPRGKKAFIWNILMALAIIISLISACYYIYSQLFS